MVTSAVVLPPVLLAVTVYVAEDVTAVGVPLMAPVEESSERPAGREGDTDQEVRNYLTLIQPFSNFPDDVIRFLEKEQILRV